MFPGQQRERVPDPTVNPGEEHRDTDAEGQAQSQREQTVSFYFIYLCMYSIEFNL